MYYNDDYSPGHRWLRVTENFAVVKISSSAMVHFYMMYLHSVLILYSVCDLIPNEQCNILHEL